MENEITSEAIRVAGGICCGCGKKSHVKANDREYCLRCIAKKIYPEIVKHFRGVGRNDICPCGSGRKYKKCHLTQNETVERIYNLDRAGRLRLSDDKPEKPKKK